MKRQVLVVGAGPAGSSAAFHLAKAGVDVLMVDKETWPRDKACGDGQPATIWPFWQEMGVFEEIKAHAYSGTGFLFSGRDEKVTTIIEKEPIVFCTPRRIVDDITRRAAIRSGSDFIENYEATQLIIERGTVKGVKGMYQGKPMDIYADAVVIAEGAHSMLARQLGIWTEDPECVFYSARGYFDNVNGLDMRCVEEHYPDDILAPSGYMWSFPMGGKKANVGVFITEKSLLKSGMRLEDFFGWWRDNTKIGKERLGEAKLIGEIKGWRIPTSRQLGKSYTAGAIVIGDSSNDVDPWDGGGYYQAILGGKICAIALTEALAKGDVSEQALSPFQTMADKEIGAHLKACAAIRDTIFSDFDVLDGALAYIRNHPDYPNFSFDNYTKLFSMYLSQVDKADIHAAKK